MELRIQNVVKTYAGKKILENFSADFPSEGTVCLFGPSGCGKTTLLNILAGLAPMDSGEVFISPLVKVCYLFQEDRLLPWATAKENVMAVFPRGMTGAEGEALRWLKAVDLLNDAEKFPSELSGGMRQRVSLARALAFGGDLFLLDEPFHALDEETKKRGMELLTRETPHALKILVTHDRAEAESLSNVIYMLEGPPLRVTGLLKTCS